jgi:CPA2 family monovalent cation:H+ antiporter-2
VTVIEDVIIISMLAKLQSISSTGRNQLWISELVISILSELAFVVGILCIDSRIIPRIVNYKGSTNLSDLLIVAILGVTFGLSFVASEIGISVATGTFFASILI